MDALLDKALRQAPEIMHHLFALKGSNRILTALSTEESRGAYMLRTIAAGLEEVGKAMGSSIQCPRPCDIEYHINTSRSQFPSFPCHITVLNFGHFEDLYLAAIATVKDYLQRLDTLIASNFKQPDEIIFVFPNEPLRALGPVRLEWLRSCLLAQQDLLESDLFTELLSRAIVFQAAHVSDAEMPEKPGFSSMIGFRQQDLREGVGHLETIRAYGCGMIFALLTEKHGLINPSQSRKGIQTPEIPMPDQEIEAVHQSSSNPYSLDERVTGLDTSGGHSKGLRVPVPTSDPSQDHLHRDASSRVHELDTSAGTLSSPILGPTARTYTGSHGSREALAPTMCQTPCKSLSPKRCTELQAYPLVYTIHTEALLICNQSIEETHQPCNPPAPGSLHYYASTTHYDCELDYLPLIHQRFFSHEELRQPFSKLCDTPPQRPVSRSIIGRRFFNFSRH